MLASVVCKYSSWLLQFSYHELIMMVNMKENQGHGKNMEFL